MWLNCLLLWSACRRAKSAFASRCLLTTLRARREAARTRGLDSDRRPTLLPCLISALLADLREGGTASFSTPRFYVRMCGCQRHLPQS